VRPAFCCGFGRRRSDLHTQIECQDKKGGAKGATPERRAGTQKVDEIVHARLDPTSLAVPALETGG